MSIPTLEAFREETKIKGVFKKFKKARGAHMIDVDHALEYYWKVIDLHERRNVIIRALCHLIRECRNWLTKKKEKKEGQSKKLSPFKSSNFARREQAVRHLADEALKVLYKVEPAFLQSQKYYDQRKQRFRQEFTVGTQKLHPGYSTEREFYKFQDKTLKFAFSGTTVQGLFDDIHRGDKPSFQSHDPGLYQLLQDKARTFENLTLDEWAQIGLFADAVMQDNARVWYMNKFERLRYLLRPGERGWLYDWRDQPASFGQLAFDKGNPYPKGQPGLLSAYAMDEHGMLYAAQDKRDTDFWREDMRWNHSSYLSGDDVICAGTWVVEAGLLRVITTESGHYQPTLENMTNAIHVLDHDHVDLTHAVAIAMVVEPGGPLRRHWFHAVDLLGEHPAPFHIE
jgi:hypothetical protein